MVMVTKPGFYGGKFRKAGQGYDGPVEPEEAVEERNLDDMTKDELVAEAARRGVQVKPADTKTEILAAIKAAEAK